MLLPLPPSSLSSLQFFRQSAHTFGFINSEGSERKARSEKWGKTMSWYISRNRSHQESDLRVRHRKRGKEISGSFAQHFYGSHLHQECNINVVVILSFSPQGISIPLSLTHSTLHLTRVVLSIPTPLPNLRLPCVRDSTPQDLQSDKPQIKPRSSLCLPWFPLYHYYSIVCLFAFVVNESFANR